jgi:formylmethanofuran dehydrogenase subunit E
MDITKDEMLELGFKFHGHRCPGLMKMSKIQVYFSIWAVKIV